MPSYMSYLRQMAVLDSDGDIQWITVKGNHIPIKKGQSKEEAVKSFFESKGKSSGGKSESKSSQKKSAPKTEKASNKISYAQSEKEGFMGGIKYWNQDDEPDESWNRKMYKLAFETIHENTDWSVDDVDRFLESKWGRSFADQVDDNGWNEQGIMLAFRKMEKAGLWDKIRVKKNEVKKVDNSKNSGKVYTNTMSKIRNFKAKEEGTFDFETGKPKNYPNGYSVSFHQNEPDANGKWKSDYGRYSDKDYDKNVADLVKETGGELNIGYFAGTPEVSVWVKDFKTAVKMAKKHNQHSIWNWKKGDVWINPDYDPKKNPMKE